MQTQKDDIKVRILEKARIEFINKGFQKASMRKIANEAGVSTSNVYNYFLNKDELFSTILEPVSGKLLAYFEKMEKEQMYADPKNWTYRAHVRKTSEIAKFIDSYREELNLIVFKSFGSSYANFKDELIEKYTSMSIDYIAKSEGLYPNLKCNISAFCLHNIASLLFNIISEILMHNISGKEMEDVLQEMMVFMFYGYEGIMEYDFSTMKPKKVEK